MSPLFARATAIVFRPRTTWRRIAVETTSARALVFGYVVPLAAIGPLATYIALRVTGVRIAADRVYHASVATALAESLTSYGFALGGVALVTLIIAGLSPRFGVSRSLDRALRVVAYAFTPVWIAGATLLVPALTPTLLVAAAYAVVLLALGIETVLGAARGRAALFAAMAIGCALASGFVLGASAAVVRGLANIPPP